MVSALIGRAPSAQPVCPRRFQSMSQEKTRKVEHLSREIRAIEAVSAATRRCPSRARL